MDRRTFMKLLGGLASMPIIGRVAKPLKSETVQEGIAAVSDKGMQLYEMVVAKVMKEGKKVGESGRVESYKHPDRPDITVDVNQTSGSAEIYFDTDRGSKGYAKIDRDMETGGDDLIEAEEVFTVDGDKDIQEGIMGGIENLDDFTRIKKNIGGQVQPYDPRASIEDFAKAIDKVGAGTDLQKAVAIGEYGQNVQRQNPSKNLGFFDTQRHFDNNQLLKNAVARGELSPADYNRLGGFDVAQTMGLGNPVLGGVGNLIGSTGYNIVQSLKGNQSPFDIPGDVFRNVQGGTGLISDDLKAQYESIINPTPTLPVEPRTDQDLIEGFKKFKQLNPDSLSGTGIAALIEGTLPDGTPITFSGGAESSAFNEYLESLGLSRADIFTPNAGTDRPTMADVAGPKEGYITLQEFEDYRRQKAYDPISAPGNVNRSKEEIEAGIKREVAEAAKDPDNYLRNYMGNFDSIIASRLKDGGSVDLTIISMPDISGSGVESLFKRR